MAEDQIRTVIKTFRDKLHTEIFHGRTEVPKTLIFAKDDSHTDDIARIVRLEFGKGNDFCQKITYRTTGIRPEELLAQFRNNYNPRIVVTVYMIATGTDFKLFMQPNRAARSSPSKKSVIEISRRQLDLVDRYVDRKEGETLNAEPALLGGAITSQSITDLGNHFIERLSTLPTSPQTAGDYQRLVYEIFNYLFEPELTDGEMEVGTFLGTERRDIVYINESECSFLKYVRETYQSLFLLMEIKNVREPELDHVNQVAAYLGARLGMFGIIVTRSDAGENIIRKTYSVFNDTPSMPKKVILFVKDDDLITMVQSKQAGREPMKQLRDIYRRFRQRVQ